MIMAVWHVIIVACTLVEPTQCHQLVDRLGPHKTFRLCEARRYHMLGNFTLAISMPFDLYSQCRKVVEMES